MLLPRMSAQGATVAALNGSVPLSLHRLLFLALPQGLNTSLGYCHWLNLEISVPSLLGMSPFSSNSLNSLVSRSTGRLPSGISQICLNLWESTVLMHAGNSGKVTGKGAGRENKSKKKQAET